MLYIDIYKSWILQATFSVEDSYSLTSGCTCGHYIIWNTTVTEKQILISKLVKLIELKSRVMVVRVWDQGEIGSF